MKVNNYLNLNILILDPGHQASKQANKQQTKTGNVLTRGMCMRLSRIILVTSTIRTFGLKIIRIEILYL